MDGTLLEEDSSWVALHKHFGTESKGKESLALYTKGDIDYEEFMRRDISAWPRGVTMDEVEEVLSKYRLRSEALPTIRRLKEEGVRTALVTSGIDILAQKVAFDLGIDHWVANGLRADHNRVLTGEGIGRVDPTRKDLAYLSLLRKLGISSKQTIAVGDTIYDLRFLKSAKKGFLLTGPNEIHDSEVIKIAKLTEIFDFI
jgi:phosphoserine phosphatase